MLATQKNLFYSTYTQACLLKQGKNLSLQDIAIDFIKGLPNLIKLMYLKERVEFLASLSEPVVYEFTCLNQEKVREVLNLANKYGDTRYDLFFTPNDAILLFNECFDLLSRKISPKTYSLFTNTLGILEIRNDDLIVGNNFNKISFINTIKEIVHEEILSKETLIKVLVALRNYYKQYKTDEHV
ncbi:hypothetical protein DB313_05690 (plasmid) [Borrelia turcica IST7]|uniref:Uncharacterized protein n=1 Tax=Borrelia turcica IST7 TaxID=1104446 RepID=A0A386PNB5_9SPIR|nr:hypothetical protein [Borrelia turcica]AYE36991.1 hypothetical protein DB313_05690 [Borrelia turcica IST7]